LPGHQGNAALLGDLISILLAPYEDTGAFSGRIRVSVPRTGVGEKAATSLALIVHELATNSVKYGALSVETGTLDVSGSMEEELVTITWTERGGPTVEAPRTKGYGSKLVQGTVAGLGSIDHDWSAEGLIINVHLKPDSLTN
jgi:two-component sensor histidine kinase